MIARLRGGWSDKAEAPGDEDPIHLVAIRSP